MSEKETKIKYVPIKVKLSVKELLINIQGKLMQEFKKKVSLSDTIKFLIDFYKY